jgi:uncharacterized membrane protein
MTKLRSPYNLLLTLLLSACGSSPDDKGPDVSSDKTPPPIVVKGPIPAATNLQCENRTYLTYDNFAAAFISNYCLACHSKNTPEAKRSGAPKAANFDTYQDAIRYRPLMISKTQGKNPTMPLGQTLTDQQRSNFGEWLNCGAPKDNGYP